MNVFLITFFILFNSSINQFESSSSFINENSIERDVLKYINEVRTNPKKFKQEILIPFLKVNKGYSNKYVKSLKKDLDQLTPLPPLKNHEVLKEFAHHHAKSTGKVGKVGHRSVLMKSYQARSNKLLKTFSYVGENIHYGSDNAKLIVLELLIDDGIRGVGHRKNILSKDYVFAGISIQPHKKFRQNCVIEFGGELVQ